MFNRSDSWRDWQRALYIPLTILAWMALILVVFWLLGHIVKTILTLVLAGIVAFALVPVVSFLSRFVPRWAAITLAYVFGFTVLFGLLALLIVTVVDEVNALVKHLPHYADQIRAYEPQIAHLLRPFGVTTADVHHAQAQATKYLAGLGTTAAKDSLSILTGVVGAIIEIVLVLILSVYLVANGPRLAKMLQRETPQSQRRHTVLLLAIVNRVIGGYIRGQLALSTLIGVLVGLGMFILHVPYAALLGVFAFFMEFIPVIGVLISGVVSVGLALFEGLLTAVLVLAYFVVVHVIEGDVVGPRIMGHAVGVHPAATLLALVAGTELFGFWGALLAAPLAGLIQAIGAAALIEMRGGDPRVVLHAAEEVAEDETSPSMDDEKLVDEEGSEKKPVSVHKA